MPYKDPEKGRTASRARGAAWRAANPERTRAKNAAWQAANPEKVRTKKAAWQAANREKYLKQRAARYVVNREKRLKYAADNRAAYPEKYRIRDAAWRVANPEKVRAQTALRPPEKARARTAKRRAIKFTQRCGCCTDGDIQMIYDTAALVGGEVDHRIPLALGGHHCMKNLQALTVEDHQEKTKTDFRHIADAKRRSKLLLQWPIAAAA
jgi:5-methylcytosine-specific restriction endonuclease McrA